MLANHFTKFRVKLAMLKAALRRDRVHLDTSPDLAGIAERRSPIRRVSGRISALAGSETGAPGGVSRCTLRDQIKELKRMIDVGPPEEKPKVVSYRKASKTRKNSSSRRAENPF